jgi:hypothetical protein
MVRIAMSIGYKMGVNLTATVPTVVVLYSLAVTIQGRHAGQPLRNFVPHAR